MLPTRERHPTRPDVARPPARAPALDRGPRWTMLTLLGVLGAALAPAALAAGAALQVGGLTLHLEGTWSVDANPGLERSLLQGRRETTTQNGVTVTQTVFPEVRSIAAYAPDGAAVIVHAYHADDVAPSLEARSTALEDAWNRQLLDVAVLRLDTVRVAGEAAQVTEYLATDPHDEVRYRGRAILLDGPEGPLLIVLEAPTDDTERYAARFDAALASATLARPAPTDTVGCAIPTDPFVGRFGDGFLTLTLQAEGPAYVGVIEADANRYALRATADGLLLAGSFTSAGSDFAFVAALDRGTLVFETGSTRYRLARLPEP